MVEENKVNPIAGGAFGKHKICPKDAAEAHTLASSKMIEFCIETNDIGDNYRSKRNLFQRAYVSYFIEKPEPQSFDFCTECCHENADPKCATIRVDCLKCKKPGNQ